MAEKEEDEDEEDLGEDKVKVVAEDRQRSQQLNLKHNISLSKRTEKTIMVEDILEKSYNSWRFRKRRKL